MTVAEQITVLVEAEIKLATAQGELSDCEDAVREAERNLLNLIVDGHPDLVRDIDDRATRIFACAGHAIMVKRVSGGWGISLRPVWDLT